MKSELVFYEGLKGSGVVAAITYNSSRVIFDFGAPFNPMTQVYDGQVEHRCKAWVNDAIRLGQIPSIDGVFSEQDLGPSSRVQPFEKSDLTTGVIISHLHLDHMSGIGMVSPEIPVYLQREAYDLQRHLDAIGESVGKRSFTPIELYQPFQIGEIRVTAFFSDHPCAGAVGYLIEPPDGKFYYSGDLRMHGSRLPQVVADMEKIARENVDVLILEMTTISPSVFEQPFVPTLEIPRGMLTEKQLLDKVATDLSGSQQLGIFNIYHRDMELIRGLFEVARRSIREIVFEPKTAYIVMQMLDLHPAVYIPDTREYESDALQPYFREVLKRMSRQVGLTEIRSAPQKFFLQNSYENLLELFDLPSRRALYYHLYGIPLVEGSRDYQNLMRVLQLTGTEYAAFADLYCYNHAYPGNLLYMAEKIRARNIIGVHSSHPERFRCRYSTQVLPRPGEVYQLDSGVLKLKRPLS